MWLKQNSQLFSRTNSFADLTMSSGDVGDLTQLRRGDIVIAVVGPSGSGKSTVGNLEYAFSPQTHDIDSSNNFTIHRLTSQNRDSPSQFPDVFLLDSPGYTEDNTSTGSTTVLRKLSDRLGPDIHLSGIIYMYKCFSTPTKDKPHLNFPIFRKLCGEGALKKVRLAISMWETTDDSDFTSQSEQVLEQGWHYMLEHGASIVKFENNRSSAWKVLGPLIAKELHARLVRSHQEYEIKNQNLRDSGGVGRQGIEGFSRDITAYRCRVDKTLRELEEGKVELEPLQILLGSLPNGVENSGIADPQRPPGRAPTGGFWKNIGSIFDVGGLISKPVPTRDMQQYESLSRVMILDILQDNEAIGRIPRAFCRSDAQLMADFLNRTMLDQTIAAVDRMRLFSMLCKLSTFANVLPSLYQVENIPVDEKAPIIAEHGHSKTYKVVNRGTTFRCKTSRPSVINDEQMNSFLHKTHIKEIVLWAHLSHLNIEPFSGFFANKGPGAETIYTLSPWMKNGNIRTYAGSIHYNARLPLIADIAEGLYYLHGLGLLHGNLKGARSFRCQQQSISLTALQAEQYFDFK
ncbi:hypothetical protein AN958_06412 [Leucoagaricus sp. SymC.cos]|nr:hypothetical protein AN958_06412 [Leucoagaricus sp. SymC.cos]